MTAIRPFVLCMLLLYLPAGSSQTTGDGHETPAEGQNVPVAAEDSGTGETAGAITDGAGAVVTPPADAATPPPGGTDEPAEAPAVSPATAPVAPVEEVTAPVEAPAAPAPADASPAIATPTVQVPAPVEFSAARPYLVVVRDGMEAAARQTPGFSISDQGHILTYSGELRTRDSYLVSTAGGQVYSAMLLDRDEDTGLMLVKIAEGGHGLGALKFARTALEAAAPLYAVKFDPARAEPFTPVAGTVSRLPEIDEDIPSIVHNALFNTAAAGTPLFNRCYQMVGVNVLQKEGFSSKTVDPEKQGSAISLAAHPLNVFLASSDLTLPLAETECLSAEEEAELQLELLQQEREAALQAERARAEAQAQALAEETQAREAALGMEKEAAQQQLEQERREQEAALQAEREQAEAEKRQLEEEVQQRLEQAQQEKEQALLAQQQEKEAALQAERQEAELARQEARQATHTGKQILLLSVAVGLALLLAFFLVMRARRKRLQGVEQEKQQIAQELDRAQAGLSDASEREQLRAVAPDVFIEGVTPQNERIALKIPGVSLVEPSGVTVGRSPAESAFVINHEQVSRRHFCLLLVSGQVMIEDMGSTNGTVVNGVPLNPGARLALDNGSRLQTGHLELTVRIGH